MKDNTFPKRLNMVVTKVLGSLTLKEKSSKNHSRNKLPEDRRGGPQRKDFFYYMQLIDDDTKEIVGHLSDISSGGFKVDSQRPIPINKDFRILMNLTAEVAGKPSMVLVARSRWCKVDPFVLYSYNVGYQLIQIAPEDLEIFNRMMEKYGKEYDKRNIDLRRPYKW